MAKKEGRSPVNVQDLTMWHMTSDDNTATVYDKVAHTFINQLNSFGYTPSVATAVQYGDGVKVEDYVAKDGGTCNAVIRGFAEDDEAFLFGESYIETAGAEVSTTIQTYVSQNTDIIPYVCVAFATRRSDGLYNLYKFPKVKWMPQGETLNQQEGTNISFGTASLQGNYAPLLSIGSDMYKVTGLDLIKDADFYDNWFTTADFPFASN